MKKIKQFYAIIANEDTPKGSVDNIMNALDNGCTKVKSIKLGDDVEVFIFKRPIWRRILSILSAPSPITKE